MNQSKEFRSVLDSSLVTHASPNEFIQRGHRIILRRPRDLVCRLEVNGDVISLPVKDISESGVGFRLDEKQNLFQMGQIISAFFKRPTGSIDVQLKVIRANNLTLGVEIFSDRKLWVGFLKNNFAIELEGGLLRLISPELLNPVESGTPWWFFAPENRELYFIVDDEKVTQFHFTYQNMHFQAVDGKLIFGKLKTEPRLGPQHANSSILIEDLGLQLAPIEEAMRFLSNIERLPAVYLEQIYNVMQGHR